VPCAAKRWRTMSRSLAPGSLARGVFTSRVVCREYEIYFALLRLEFSGQVR
jgi:hypothetical protein